MPRHRLRHVAFSGPTRPSAVRLDKALIALGYEGGVIAWGAARFSKRSALERFRAQGVPCPRAWGECPNASAHVMRTDNHRAGEGFWLVRTQLERQAAVQQGATHGMEFIEDAREFRVHIVHGRSIKLTEKIYDRDAATEIRFDHVHSRAAGWRQVSPQPNAHKVSLRRHAKTACEALGAPFGAVDILMRHDPRSRPATEFFVLEVNTAPALTDPNTDTCERYARAFLRGPA